MKTYQIFVYHNNLCSSFFVTARNHANAHYQANEEIMKMNLGNHTTNIREVK